MLNQAASSESEVLWNVVEEHLNEAAFGVEQLDQTLEHPTLTLRDLARYPEARLLAHLDGLVVGGAPLAERLLLPLLEADEISREHAVAAALALILGGRHALLLPVLRSSNPVLRAALVRASALAGGAELEAFVSKRLTAQPDALEHAALLDVLAARRMAPPPLMAALQSDDPILAGAAARAARGGEATTYLPVMEYLLEHAEPSVREAALITTLAWASAPGWAACQRRALDADAPVALAMTLYSALGGRGEHERLVQQHASGAARKQLLFALAFSGDCAQVPWLIEQLTAEDALEAKLAAHAIAAISGLDLTHEALALSKPVQAPTPEGEDEDLDAELVPPPEDALPPPNPAAIERAFRELSARFDPERRYLAGMPYGVEAALEALERGPLRRRHMLALELGIRSAGVVWIETRAFSAAQSAQLARVSANALGVKLRTFRRW